jgi:hypothetical protein
MEGIDGECAEIVDGTTEGIEHPTEDMFADGDLGRGSRRLDGISGGDSLEIFPGHQEKFVVTEADDFGKDAVPLMGLNPAGGAERGGGTLGFDGETDDLGDAA